jgi:phosphoribosylformylglycinamidine (FGAM) synthase PurS component
MFEGLERRFPEHVQTHKIITQGTKTFKYLKEKKSTEIALVAASESAKADGRCMVANLLKNGTIESYSLVVIVNGHTKIGCYNASQIATHCDG